MEYRELLRQQELAAQRREHGPAADASERSLRLYPGSALREVVAASAHPLNLEPLLLTLARDGNEELRRRFGEAAGEVVLISKALGYGAVVGDLQVVAGRRVVDARDGFAYPAVASSSSAGAAGAAGDEKKKKKNKADATASVVAAGKAAAAAPAASAPAGPSPVHLTVDTSLTGDRVAVRAYVSRALVLGGRALATEFVPVPSRIQYADLERAGADLLLSGAPSSSKPVATEHETLQTSVRRLQGLLAIARSYADDVASGRRRGDPAIGRCLDDALAAAPALPAAEFEALVAQGVQDALLVDHLAHLVRAQIALAERLGTAALPLL